MNWSLEGGLEGIKFDWDWGGIGLVKLSFIVILKDRKG